jgi:histidinol-phosphatase (PHP family)
VIDLHVHTWRCRHAEGTAEDYVRAAAATGVTTLAFTDHMPLAPSLAERAPGARGYAMPLDEFDAYVAEVESATEVGREVGVEVLLGVEVDAVPASFEHTRELLGSGCFDVVLGSVHFIDEWAFDDPDLRETYARWRTIDLWERYFADLEIAARSGLADVVAHADLVKKFCGRPEEAVGHLYCHAAEVLSEVGVAVEVNTAGLRKPCHEIYPALGFLTELRKAGVRVTIGSDAHRPDEVGRDFPEAVALLRAAGYKAATVFRRRVPEEVGLDALER